MTTGVHYDALVHESKKKVCLKCADLFVCFLDVLLYFYSTLMPAQGFSEITISCNRKPDLILSHFR